MNSFLKLKNELLPPGKSPYDSTVLACERAIQQSSFRKAEQILEPGLSAWISHCHNPTFFPTPGASVVDGFLLIHAAFLSAWRHREQSVLNMLLPCLDHVHAASLGDPSFEPLLPLTDVYAHKLLLHTSGLLLDPPNPTDIAATG